MRGDAAGPEHRDFIGLDRHGIAVVWLGDVSDAVRNAVRKYAGAFRDGDVLRMLRLLAEAEQVIRRSPNARACWDRLCSSR